MALKTFVLQTKMAVHDKSIISIPNPMMDQVIPFYISNTTGAKIGLIKGTINNVESTGKCSIKISIYSIEANLMRSKLKVDVDDVIGGEEGWVLMDSFENIDIEDYTTSIMATSKISVANIDAPSFLIGVARVNGELKAYNLSLYIDYENNIVEGV